MSSSTWMLVPSRLELNSKRRPFVRACRPTPTQEEGPHRGWRRLAPLLLLSLSLWRTRALLEPKPSHCLLPHFEEETTEENRLPPACRLPSCKRLALRTTAPPNSSPGQERTEPLLFQFSLSSPPSSSGEETKSVRGSIPCHYSTHGPLQPPAAMRAVEAATHAGRAGAGRSLPPIPCTSLANSSRSLTVSLTHSLLSHSLLVVSRQTLLSSPHTQVRHRTALRSFDFPPLPLLGVGGDACAVQKLSGVTRCGEGEEGWAGKLQRQDGIMPSEPPPRARDTASKLHPAHKRLPATPAPCVRACMRRHALPPSLPSWKHEASHPRTSPRGGPLHSQTYSRAEQA